MDGTLRTTLISQAYLLVLAAVLAAAPRYYLLVFLIYLAIVFGFSMYASRRSLRGAKVSREEIEASRQLFAEKNALDLAATDDELFKLYSKQVKGMILYIALLPLYWAIFETARRLMPSFEATLSAYGLSTVAARFILWVAAFEAMFAISMLTRKLTVGGFFTTSPAQQPPTVPASYIVTEKGILVRGAIGNVIGFPLPEGTEVILNEQKNYVEIRFKNGGRLRLYTKRPRRLYEIIQRFGKPSRQTSSTSGK